MNGQIVVLLLEDNPSDAEFVRIALAENNGVSFRLTVVNRLADAVVLLHRTKVDVVLLDLGLPDSQGLATLQRVYQVCELDTAIVVLTGNEDEELGPQTLQLGAQDYLNKKHITNGGALTRSMRYGYERKQREQMERQFAQAQRSFEAARAIQQYLLPKRAPLLPGFDIFGTCQPADATGGDFFDYIPMANGCLGITVADVASHGFGPALIMAGTRRALRTLAKTNVDPGSVLTLVNEAVCEDTDPERFVTMFLASLDPAGRQFSYAGAGHNAHLLDADGRVTHLAASGIPLGLLEDCVYVSGGCLPLERGQILLLMSDGIQEAQASDGSQFGMQTALDYIREFRTHCAQAIVEGLISTVRQFCHPAKPLDDMTVVVVKIG